MTRVPESEALQRKGAVNLFAGHNSHVTKLVNPVGYKIELTHEIKEHQKLLEQVKWAPNGLWIVSCSRRDYAARIWDVSNAKEKKQKLNLENHTVCILRKH